MSSTSWIPPCGSELDSIMSVARAYDGGERVSNSCAIPTTRNRFLEIASDLRRSPILIHELDERRFLEKLIDKS